MTTLFAFKLFAPPLLILLASLAGRRWGESLGGWLVRLPLTSGPVSAFLALQYGADFAARATDGSLAGCAAQGVFSLGYALAAERGIALALATGLAGYAAAGFALRLAAPPHAVFFMLALASLTLSARLIRPREPARGLLAPPWWDLPARMIVATALVVSLTFAAAFVGAETAGVLASVPVFGAILAAFAQAARGPAVALQTLRGMTLALYGFATFFFVLGLALTRLGVVAAFLTAAVGAGAAQATALAVMRRRIILARKTP